MEKTRFAFTMPLKVSVVEVKGEEKVYMEGLLSTSDLDLVNDIVTKNCLESMKNQIISRNIKLDIEHEAFRGTNPEQKEINKTIIPVGKFTDASVQEIEKGRWGLKIKAVLNAFNPRYKEIKGNVIDGFLDAYSIAFIATKARNEIVNGQSIRFLDDLNLLNAALTGNPVNTQALNTEVFMKSISSIEEYMEEKKSHPDIEKLLEVKSQSHSHESDKLNRQEVKMSEQTTELKEGGVHGGLAGKEGGNASSKVDETTSSTVSQKAPKKDDETTSTLEETKARLEALEFEIKALKAIPVMKSPMESPKVALEQKSVAHKSVGPLDYI